MKSDICWKLSLLRPFSELDFWVESVPPVTSIASGPKQDQAVSSSPTFNFSSASPSASGIPMAASLCRLVQLSSSVSQQYATAPASSNSLPGDSFKPAGGNPLALSSYFLKLRFCRIISGLKLAQKPSLMYFRSSALF